MRSTQVSTLCTTNSWMLSLKASRKTQQDSTRGLGAHEAVMEITILV